MTTNPTVTDDEIDAALLQAVDAVGDELVPWAELRRQLPGSRDRAGERLVALWQSGEVYLIKASGRNFVGRGDHDDRRLAAAQPNRSPLDLHAPEGK